MRIVQDGLKPLRCAVYLRISDPNGDRDDRFGLERQEHDCRAYAAQRGWIVVAVLSDCHTGKDLYGRAGMTTLRELVRSGQVDVVLAHALDRLARKATHQGMIFTEAEHAGVAIALATETVEDTPEGRMMLAIKAGMAEMEREKIVDRTMGGKRAKVRSGKPLGSGEPPFGLMFSADKSHFVEDPDEVIWLRWMFSRAASGQSFRSIAAELEQHGVLPPYHHRTGSTRWGQPSVMRILANGKYVGAGACFETAWEAVPGLTKSGKPRKRLITLAPGDPRRIELPAGVYPAVIDPSLFAAVQARAAVNRRETQRKDRDPRDGLFRRGFAVCGLCGGSLVVRKHSKPGLGYYYSCGGATRWSCGKVSIMTHLLDSPAWASVERILNRPSVIEERLAQLRQENTTGPELEVVDRFLDRIGQEQAKVARAIRLLADEDAAAPLLAELANLAKTRKGALAERDELVARQQGLENDRRRLREAVDYTAEVRRQVAAENAVLGWDAKRTALQRLQVKVLVFPANQVPRWIVEMRWEDKDSKHGGMRPYWEFSLRGIGTTEDVVQGLSNFADSPAFERPFGAKRPVEDSPISPIDYLNGKRSLATASASSEHSSSVVR